MKDRETELLERWRKEIAMYSAWGAFVSETLTAAIGRQIQPQATDRFLRIPIAPRIKEEASLLAKAFHRGKPYTNPYDEIEDKVGIRIVVLFSKEIRVVETTITASDQWTAEKARDFEEERDSRPFEFDYQSLHYVVRSKEVLARGSVDIAVGVPCEIQVRTILQHAYSELTHDTIYKPKVQAEPRVKRAAAKSMALIEATDDYFTQVRDQLATAEEPGQRVAAALNAHYRAFTALEPEPSPLDTLIVDHYKAWAGDDFEVQLSGFLQEKTFLADFIRERASTQLLYRQPSVLLVYLVIKDAPRGAVANSPLSNQELAPMYGDLGERLPDVGA